MSVRSKRVPRGGVTVSNQETIWNAISNSQPPSARVAVSTRWWRATLNRAIWSSGSLASITVRRAASCSRTRATSRIRIIDFM